MKDPLRIAFIGPKGYPATWGGIEVHAAALAVRLAARGHDVTVYHRRWYGPVSGERIRGVRQRTLPTVKTKNTDCIVHSLLATLDAARGRYDVVHYHGIGPALTSILLARSSCRIVATVHCLDYEAEKWGLAGRTALRAGERMAFLVADRALAVSRAMATDYSRRGRECTYLPSGVEIRPPLAARRIRSELGLEPGRYLLSMGRWTVDKRLTGLVDAFLEATPGDFRLVVAGETDPGSPYARRVRAATRGSSRIVLPGVVGGDRKRELLSNAFAFVSASRTEGLPIVLLEAMSYGRPSLVSDIAAHREAVADGETGLLFPGTERDDLVRGFERLLAMPATAREEMGRRARALVKREYDWERIVDRLETIYREVLSPLG